MHISRLCLTTELLLFNSIDVKDRCSYWEIQKNECLRVVSMLIKIQNKRIIN